MAWLFKHPQSGSKGHLSRALTFPDSISLLCCCIALFARPAPKSPKLLCVCVCCVLWADLDGLLDNYFQMRKRTCVHIFYLCVYTLCERLFKCVRLSICLYVHACVCVYVFHFFTLGSLNVGHKALRHSLEMFGPHPHPIFQAVLQSAVHKSNPLRLNFQFHFL